MVNQLTFLYSTFSQSLDSGKDVRVVFCDGTKVFCLNSKQLASKILSLLGSALIYLTGNRELSYLVQSQNGTKFLKVQFSDRYSFLLFINDIVKDKGCNICLFEDDTSLFLVVENPDIAAELLNLDLDKIMAWAKKWLVRFNPVKPEAFLTSRKINNPIHPPLFMAGTQITEVDSHIKHLGVIFQNDGSWHNHIDYVKEKALTIINAMKKIKFDFDRKSLETVYLTFIRPILEYADVVWDNCTQYEKNELDKIQNEAARIVTGTTQLVSIRALYEDVKWNTLEERRRKHKLALFYKMVNGLSPPYLSSLIPPPRSSSYNLRNTNNIQTIHARTNQYYNSFLPSVIRDWNNLTLDVRNSDSLYRFKRNLNNNDIFVPKYFYSGIRKLQILHTRLRTGCCSSLNHDLFVKHITDSPLCFCGDTENTEHYFLSCPLYQNQRIDLNITSSRYTVSHFSSASLIKCKISRERNMIFLF